MLAVITFVRTALKHWQAGLIGLLLLGLAVQTVRLGHRGNQLERAKINLNEARAELKAISDAKDKQLAETSKRIEQADKGNREADGVARRIEEAPLSGDCRTPDVILKADI